MFNYVMGNCLEKNGAFGVSFIFAVFLSKAEFEGLNNKECA